MMLNCLKDLVYYMSTFYDKQTMYIITKSFNNNFLKILRKKAKRNNTSFFLFLNSRIANDNYTNNKYDMINFMLDNKDYKDNVCTNCIENKNGGISEIYTNYESEKFKLKLKLKINL